MTVVATTLFETTAIKDRAVDTGQVTTDPQTPQTVIRDCLQSTPAGIGRGIRRPDGIHSHQL